MLVGALSYALPLQQETYRLAPCLVGLTISLMGVLSAIQTRVLIGNIVNCLLLIVYSISSFMRDNRPESGLSSTMADCSVVLFCLIFIITTARYLLKKSAA